MCNAQNEADYRFGAETVQFIAKMTNAVDRPNAKDCMAREHCCAREKQTRDSPEIMAAW
jgi:hypothetical protein